MECSVRCDLTARCAVPTLREPIPHAHSREFGTRPERAGKGTRVHQRYATRSGRQTVRRHTARPIGRPSRQANASSETAARPDRLDSRRQRSGQPHAGGTPTPTHYHDDARASSSASTRPAGSSSGARRDCTRATCACSATWRASGVLEVGCGSAPCARWLAGRGARAVGLDLSMGMLEPRGRGDARAAVRGCRWCRRARRRLPFADGQLRHRLLGVRRGAVRRGLGGW